MRYAVFVFLVLTTRIMLAQSSVSTYDNAIFDERVKSILLLKSGTDDRYPIISLNSAEQLKLSFDMLDTRNENLQYTLIHCNSSWEPSRLNQNEYLNGMNFDNISDFKFSTNTFVRYVHYALLLPNENLKPKFAGNYILKVYRNYDESDLLFTRRLMVLNNQTNISAQAKQATLAEYRFTKQEVQFTIEYNPIAIPNPLQDVKVVVMQNYRWDNAITDLTPLFANNNKLDYNYLDKNLFSGSNEFRYFDIRSLKQFSPNVRSKIVDSVVRVILNIDEARGSMQYFQYLDYDGKLIIGNKDGYNPDLDADYAYVNFFLNSLGSSQEQPEMYVLGEFTDWKLKPEFKMDYNRIRNRYDLQVPLKQGRYEYVYAMKNTETGKPDEALFEGSHSQTENEYLILVYAKNQLYGYEELIGAKKIVSNL